MLYDQSMGPTNACPICELPLRRVTLYVDGEPMDAWVCDECKTIDRYILED